MIDVVYVFAVIWIWYHANYIKTTRLVYVELITYINICGIFQWRSADVWATNLLRFPSAKTTYLTHFTVTLFKYIN